MIEPNEFDDFVRTRHERLCRIAYVLCGDWQHAEDLVQTALAKTYVAFRRGGIESLDAYTHRTLVTTHASWWRRRWHSEVPTSALPDSTTARDAYAAADLQAAVLTALSTLPARQRAVLALRFLADLSEADTAAAMGCARGTVKSCTNRALATLRDSGLLTEREAVDA